MDTILFLAHTESDGTLSSAAMESLATAQKLQQSLPGSTLAAGLIGVQNQTAADSLAQSGCSRFLSVEGEAFAQSRYATDAAAAEALCKTAQATMVIAPHTARFARCLPGVAYRLNGRADTHATGVEYKEGALVVNRWYYRQRLESVLKRTSRPWIILMDPGCATAWKGSPSPVTLEKIAVTLDAAHERTRVTGIQAPPADQQTIRPDAKVLFVAGAGWTKKQADGQPHVKDAEVLIRQFLDKARASLGSSKSLVDLGGEGQAVLSFLTHLNQIGQTGSTPRHPKGLATCCHGEEPHTVGWRFINERRAINLDPNCGWARGKADVLYVADAFAVMKRLNALLS